MKQSSKLVLVLALQLGWTTTLFSQSTAPDSQPPLLSFDELKQLADLNPLAGPLAEKVRVILRTPFVSNAAARSGSRPIILTHPQLGKSIRAAQWNIERGMNLDLIKTVFVNPAEFTAKIDPKVHAPGSADYQEAAKQADLLRNSSILVINEADLGMTRSDYRDVTAELAQATRMNYAFGVEFLEIDKIQLGMEELGDSEEEKVEFRKALAMDPSRYKGLHGSAILSRYPILSARLVPLQHQCYDWYLTELEKTSPLEGAKRGVADKIFLERVIREVRRGGRAVLIADLAVPELPERRVTVVSVHLENRCKPGCREDQMKEVLALIAGIRNPVIMAGDLNTTGSDSTPTSLRRELKKRYKDPSFWGTQAVKRLTPYGLTLDAIGFGLDFGKISRDPTSDKIPLLAPHTEGELFDEIKDFRFADGKAFDFRGDAARASEDKSKKLANSNERAKIGFAPTFKFERKLENVVGEFKLDWFFVKPYVTDPDDEKQSYRFAPHFGQTLDELNEAVEDRISDHAPIIIDLPLNDPRRSAEKHQGVFGKIKGVFHD